MEALVFEGENEGFSAGPNRWCILAWAPDHPNAIIESIGPPGFPTRSPALTRTRVGETRQYRPPWRELERMLAFGSPRSGGLGGNHPRFTAVDRDHSLGLGGHASQDDLMLTRGHITRGERGVHVRNEPALHHLDQGIALNPLGVGHLGQTLAGFEPPPDLDWVKVEGPTQLADQRRPVHQ